MDQYKAKISKEVEIIEDTKYFREFANELDKVIVSELNSTYLISSYGKFYEEMTQLFETNSVFKANYKQIIEEEQFKLPIILENFEDVVD